MALPSIATPRNIDPITARQAGHPFQIPRGLDEASVRAENPTTIKAKAPASKMEVVPRWKVCHTAWLPPSNIFSPNQDPNSLQSPSASRTG